MKKIFHVFFILAYLCLLPYQFAFAASKPFVLTEQEKAWLADHPVIKVGIDAGYAPYSFLDTDGSFIGVAPDFIHLLSQKLGVKIEAVPNLSWPEIVDGARNRTLDLIATAVITEERKTFLTFTQIYIPTPLVIMARIDDDRFKSPDALEGRTVALVKKYSSSQQVIKDYPTAKVIAVDTPAEGLHAVSSGKVDSYVGVIGINLHQAQKQGITNLKVASNYNIQTNGQRFAVRSDWPELANMLERALASVGEVERKSIYDKWISVSYVEQADYSLLWKVLLVFLFIVGLMILHNRRMAAEISIRKNIEKELLKLNQKIEQAMNEANRANNAKSEFLSIMSHELRTPLTSIKGALGLVMNDVSGNIPKDAKKMLNVAFENSERLNMLVNDILDYEKLQSGNMLFQDEEVVIDELLSKAVILNKGFADQYNVQLELGESNCGHRTLMVDMNRVLQVFSNLISNAIKYSPRGESVVIDSVCSGNKLRISISDKGSGVPEEFRDQIFSHFSQADSSDTREKGGTGLGLAISKEIIEHYNGNIGYESVTGHTTQFYFELDLVAV